MVPASVLWVVLVVHRPTMKSTLIHSPYSDGIKPGHQIQGVGWHQVDITKKIGAVINRRKSVE